jgi:peptidylprolyl isomerase
MKLTAILLLIPSLALAQTATKPKSATAAHPHPAATAAHGCVKESDLSPRIPALPADAPCPKHLYTLTFIPTVRLDNVSPFEGTDLATRLDIGAISISLDYVDTKIGAGELAAPHKYYTVNYTGYLTDGTVFDSSAIQGQPHVFLYGDHKVIPGWDTGLNGMHVGGKRRLFIPYQLAYGLQGRPPKIPAKAELVFDVELLSQSDTAPPPPSKPTAPAPTPVRPPTPPTISPAPAAAPAPPPATAAPPATAPAPTPATPPKPQ